jgi:hypothetical protein
MAASIFVDPCIKLNHRKGSLMRGKPKPRTPFGGGWASALWSDVVGDYREYTGKIDESQIFLYQRRCRSRAERSLDASKRSWSFLSSF